eukprot:COSAG06_NODE_1302_length_9933_cov_7.954342_14_plen_115_part_00
MDLSTNRLHCSALRHSALCSALLCCYACCRDWELNFKVLKQRNKELDRLPTDMRVDCFTVATQDLKATIESHMKALSDGAAADTCRFFAVPVLIVENRMINLPRQARDRHKDTC